MGRPNWSAVARRSIRLSLVVYALREHVSR
nr:MAG TPA: hypothetical protein [Caudoviricetes sp.]DAS36956.1 MAG TPA: hypothetical protein [Caudoviricetes sp.]DAU84091.1 MAG TPA: hypothetical protein [Caudoviricetes sp.]